MGQTRNSNLVDEKTPLLAGKPTTVVSIHHVTIPVTSTCVMNRKFKRLALNELDNVALNPILIRLDYSSIASLLGVSPILTNKIKKLLANNQELLNQCLQTCDLLGLKLIINTTSVAQNLQYAQQLKISNTACVCSCSKNDCCNFTAIGHRESIFNQYKNPDTKSNRNCCNENDKAACNHCLSLCAAQFLFMGAIFIVVGATNNLTPSNFLLAGFILMILGGLNSANIAIEHIKHRYRGNFLIAKAKQNSDDLVEKISGYNPSKGIRFLVARSKLYAALVEKKALPKEANQKQHLTYWLSEHFIYTINANNCSNYLLVIAMLDAVNIDNNNPPGMQRYRDIRHANSFVSAMNDAKTPVKISISDMKSARL